jgi:hypothetical protein
LVIREFDVRRSPAFDYGAKAGEQVEVFMQAIRWSNADSLYAADRHLADMA